MAIYATGASGTIGRNLSAKVISIKLDLQAPILGSSLPEFFEQDSLIHLAGIVGPGLVDEDLDVAHQINVVGTLNLAERFLIGGGGRFIYVSTSHVYENSLEPIMETSSVNPISNYAKQKLKAEQGLMELFQHKQEKLCIARVFSVLDWDVAPFTLGGAISKLADPNSDYILRNSDDIRDFLTPSKIAEILEKISITNSLFGIVNLCSGIGTKVLDAAATMLAQKGCGVPAGRVEPGNSNAPFIVGDNSILKSHLLELDLRWSPSTRT